MNADLHERLLAALSPRFYGDHVLTEAQRMAPYRALRKVVELHQRATPDAYSVCAVCCDNDLQWTLWPCSTIRALATELGVEVPDG